MLSWSQVPMANYHSVANMGVFREPKEVPGNDFLVPEIEQLIATVTIAPTSASSESKSSKSLPKSSLSQWLAVMVKNLLLLTTGNTNPDLVIDSLSNGKGVGNLEWMSYLNILLVPFGGLISGLIAHFLGRKRTLQFSIIPLLAFRTWSVFADGWQLIFSLVMTNLCSELFIAPVLTYVAESAEPSNRGTLATSSATSMMMGSFVQLFMKTFLTPRTAAIINCLVPLICACLLHFIPESPHWLIQHNKPDQAKKSLAWLRGWKSPNDVDDEFQEMLSHHGKTITASNTLVDKNGSSNDDATATPPKKTVWQQFVEHVKNFVKVKFIWPLAIVAFVFFLVHFTGTTTLLSHPDQIFATLKTPMDKNYLVVLLGTANSFGCFVSLSLIQKYGKWLMALFSLIGIGLCTIIIATYAYLNGIMYVDVAATPANVTTIHTLADANMTMGQWIPVFVLFGLTIISYCGISNLPSMLVGELFPQETRSSGIGISAAIASLFGSIVSKTFVPLVAAFTFPGMYWFYGAISFLGFIVLYFILPETEGKSLQEIENHFSGVSKLDNKVAKSKQATAPVVSINIAKSDQSTQTDIITVGKI